MFKFRNDTRFIEYLRASAGQYSIKAEQKVIENKEENRFNTNWIPIGYITKKFSKDDNKYVYTATDSAGNPIFQDIKELHVLKQEFRNNGKQLAQNAQIVHLAKINQLNKTETKGIPQRNSDIKKLRETKDEKFKKQEVLKQEQKAKYTKIENEMDTKNTQKNKDNKQDNSEKISEEQNQESDTASSRMDELNEIREQNNDKEQDLEIDR